MNKQDMIVKHLEMIQAVVSRMANNSFALKGWSIAIISAILALNLSTARESFIGIAYLPAFAFWYLDGYFLSQERYFRRLYDKVRAQLVSPTTAEEIEFFSMAAPRYAQPSDAPQYVMMSETLIIFHGMILLSITVPIIILAVRALMS